MGLYVSLWVSMGRYVSLWVSMCRCVSLCVALCPCVRAAVPPQSVSITWSPRSVRAGQPVELSCSAGSARPSPTLRWERGGTELPAEPLPPLPSSFGGLTARSRLRLLLTAADQGQRVTCVATSHRLGATVSAEHRLLVRRE
ncbi:cell adhesion molecule 1-like [Numida meleagris]|uniref:cell adhesion molecule 1-like n=1 Tax=Numida meleagris TaxID=8996 RepID=UPI000B3DCE61|nr:cell adhesion molecule 1-like [Numida meleagris]